MYGVQYSSERLIALFWRNIAVLATALLFRWLWRWREGPKSGGLSRPTAFDLEKIAPYPSEQIKGFEKHRIRMALKKMDRINWLTVDRNYCSLYEIRNTLFNTQKEKMVQCLPEAREACQEALREVVTFLCKRYPAMFETYASSSGQRVRNNKTGEEFSLNGWDDSLSPLEIAARLSMDDMNIILKNKEGMHYMAATASCFQIGWRADERIGETIARMHAPVPQWEKEIGYAVNKFMTRLAPEMPMERASYFIQVSRPGQQLPEILFQPDGVVHTDLEPQAEHLIIRKERQSFTQLPKSGAVLFNVKMSLTYLPDLPLEELRNMVKEINSWPEDMAKYKGREHWGLVVHEHCKKRERDEVR
ncbi:hypothetical protein D8B26_002798 [Coccidioides posadasii str. Silveira]|uniref:Uncharacterized protein n=1 Tax=Coccidioides posadasii (strain RMSCC 757 / Silveira) TaxID=443226 RepID=E9CY89_COCPS|nr:conserved hypothetical protein [Coccidioides posadasii str. Silveira]QVM08100.1 hypothetical protein D8B26_002798 [Coccidioides posadasii str. Silveira]